jgi:outer membrane protein
MRSLIQGGVSLICGSLMLIGGFGCAARSSTQGPQTVDGIRTRPPGETAPQPPLPEAAGAPTTSEQTPPGALPPQQPIPTAGADVPVLTLERLIEIALENQPSINAARAAREGAEARLGIAWSDYFPSLNATYNYNRATANVAGGISASTGNPTPRRVTGRSVNNQNFTATLDLTVFDSLRREGRIDAARATLNAAGLDLSTTRQNVVLNVQQAYYSYLLALRLVQVAQEALQRSMQNLERARGFFEVGTRPKIDVTRAQVDVANDELALVQARNQAATSLAVLNNVIGVPDPPPYRIVEDLEIPVPVISLEESTRVALDNRTELQAAQARVRSAEANLAVAKRTLLPSLDAVASWSYRGQDYPLAPNWLAGVTLTVPVLNPPLFYQIEEVAANLASAQADEEIIRQNIFLEVQRSYADLVSAREAIEASEVLLQQARENLELATGRYQVGVGPLIDVTDAQLALTQAESQHVQALVRFKTAEAQLRKAMGLLAPAFGKLENGDSSAAAGG